ncbi:zf-HC2 domain-containing protein [Gorillibacterium sp. sgz500922]|uniref:zf-HC2 domain-containing protein n=1 Tax=Gorillibacterium sp. sgz500922 TaxID=3446694 RepID=UPI003F672E02
MTHYSLDTWRSYQEDLLTEQERRKLEEHLEGCDRCLALYLEALQPALDRSAVGTGASEAVEAAAWTDAIMERLTPYAAGENGELPQPAPLRRRERWFERKLVHYAAAAAITAAILSTGVLDAMRTGLDRLEQTAAAQPAKPGVADRLMERTTSLLDTIQPKENGGTRRVP